MTLEMTECHGVAPLELAIWSRVSFNKIAKYPHCLSGMIFIHVQLLKPQAKYMHITYIGFCISKLSVE